MQRYEQTHASTLAVMKVPHEEVNKYGVIDPGTHSEPELYDVKQFFKKPDVEKLLSLEVSKNSDGKLGYLYCFILVVKQKQPILFMGALMLKTKWAVSLL